LSASENLEQLDDRVLAGGAGAANRLRDLEHVVGRLVHAHEERDLDVGAHVVHADEAVGAVAVDLDPLDGDVHQLGLVNDGKDHDAGKRHLGATHAVADKRTALLDLVVAGQDADDARE